MSNTANNLEQYLNDLLTDAGFAPQDPGRPALIEDLKPIILERIQNTLLAQLDGPDQETAMSMLEGDDFNGFLDYCHHQIAHFDQAMGDILNTFADEYLENFDHDDEEIEFADDE